MAEESVAHMPKRNHSALNEDLSSKSDEPSFDDGQQTTVVDCKRNDNVSKIAAPVEIKSLTVRLNCEWNETWRSPPTYCGGDSSLSDGDNDNFTFPEGWIEVERLEPTSPSRSCSRQRWEREYHPPNQPGHKGSTKICHSIEDVKKYIHQQKAKLLKEERFWQVSSSRVSGRRKVTPNQTLAATNTVSSSETYPQEEGTQSELTKIMKHTDKQTNKMRQSILYSAVLSRKKDTLLSDTGFIGANGKLYPDLRKAFGKYIDMKQCSLCKKHVQGAWYCRIRHTHLDKPDWDGGNSAECLSNLFIKSIEELEGMLSNLFDECQKKNALNDGFENDDYSMNMLSEDLLYQIASYLPSLSQLVSFCQTSKRSQYLFYQSVHSEKLFRGIFLRSFGDQGTRGNFERDLTWRERWLMVRDLRRGLVQQCIRPPNAVTRQVRASVGVLPPQDESDAIYYDNYEHGDPERAYCNGYFGMETLHLPHPPNAAPSWQPPVIVRGDFNGIRIFSSYTLFYQNGRNRNDVITIGDDEEGGQVLSLIQCDDLSDQREEFQRPCCFIGYASGRVAAVCATLNASGDNYIFVISGTAHAHGSEVTALTFVNCSSSEDDKEVPVLFSACCGGKVYCYPNALNSEQGFCLEKSLLAITNSQDCPIFSLTSTTINSFSVLCTGDRDGNISLWIKSDDDLVGLCTSTTEKFRLIKKYKSSTQSGTSYHLVTRAMFIHDNMLITGTNNGDVRLWQLQCRIDSSRSSPYPHLTLRYDLNGIHNGAVELLVNVGDVLLTSGGNDGCLIGWDINTGLKLGSVRCHHGRCMHNTSLKSCVVDLLISAKDSTMISVCRDGSLKQLKVR